MDSNYLVNLMIQQGKLPSEVYKYIRINEGLLKTLINGEIWFPSPLRFNDPFDCQLDDQTIWTDDLIREYLTTISNGVNLDIDKIINEKKFSTDSFSEYYTETQRKITSQKGVTCFTNRPCNMLMWGHYADSHQGVCLKFDITKDTTDFFKFTFKVQYSKNYPQIDFLKERNNAAKIIMTTKSDYWSYEDEIRTIKESGDKVYPFDKQSLREIIFGINSTDNNIKTIKNICKSNGYVDLKFKKVYIKPKSFNIEIIDI
jgi:hypothetical protein